MEPSLHDGDVVLVRRTKQDRLRAGQVVVVSIPALPGRERVTWEHQGWAIKRVVALEGQALAPEFGGSPGDRVPTSTMVLAGDNQDVSLDSRQLGPYPARSLLGVVVFRLTRSQPAV